jgi:hypothetical protein
MKQQPDRTGKTRETQSVNTEPRRKAGEKTSESKKTGHEKQNRKDKSREKELQEETRK